MTIDTWPAAPEDWSLRATERLIMDITSAACADTSEAARAETIEALERFYDVLDDHPDVADRTLYVALSSACATAYKVAPAGTFGTADGPMTLVMEDRHTGRAIADPDAEIADDPDGTPGAGRGTLAALRFFTAVANEDTATAVALFDTMRTATQGGEDDRLASLAFIVTVLEYAGHTLADVVRPDRPLAAPDEDAPAAEPAVRHDPATGLEFVKLPVDPRDRHPDDRANIVPHGDARYALTMFRYGTPGYRDKVVATALAALESAAAEAGEALCGVRHDEDAAVDRIPHSARRHARRALRDAARRHGGTWGLARVWQHYGTCPDDSRAPSDLDVPLFDLPADA